MDNYFFETPENVAKLLSKYLPKDINNILDPSVGTGALLRPLLENTEKNKINITAIDINRDILKTTKNYFKNSNKKLKFICDDFIEWGQNAIINGAKFDCIIMNPPFCSRKEMYVTLDSLDTHNIKNKKIPREIAFLYLSIKLLSKKGQLVAILPGSVVSAKSNNWLREVLLNAGTIKLVHELPRFTFPNVESKIYLLVFENRKSNRQIKFLNHSITHSTSFDLQKKDLCDEIRLDYGYIESRKKIKNFIQKSKYDWVKLSEIADIYRGDHDSNIFKGKAIHSSDYCDGFWKRKSKYKQLSKNIYVSQGDIIVKRVGRGCANSFGLFVAPKNTPCTDCVLIIKAKNKKQRNLLLFGLRCWSSNKYVQKTLQKGTGATYISASDLSSMMLPIDLYKIFPNHYRNYLNALKNMNFSTMKKIELEISKKIAKK